jgi:hypothetical protein
MVSGTTNPDTNTDLASDFGTGDREQGAGNRQGWVTSRRCRYEPD